MVMSKKLGELTLNECVDICNKHMCRECPLDGVCRDVFRSMPLGMCFKFSKEVPGYEDKRSKIVEELCGCRSDSCDREGVCCCARESKSDNEAVKRRYLQRVSIDNYERDYGHCMLSRCLWGASWEAIVIRTTYNKISNKKARD